MQLAGYGLVALVAVAGLSQAKVQVLSRNQVLARASETGKFDKYHRRFMFGSVAENLAETFGTKGSPISLSTACASGRTTGRGPPASTTTT